MSTSKSAFQSVQALTITNLNSLADGGAWQSGAINNSGSSASWPDGQLYAKIALASGDLSPDPQIRFYLAAGDHDGTNFESNAAGSEGTITLRDPPGFSRLGAPFVPSAGGLTFNIFFSSMASWLASGGILTPYFQVIIENRTGRAFGPSGNQVEWLPVGGDIS